jgi:hypothetical protein
MAPQGRHSQGGGDEWLCLRLLGRRWNPNIPWADLCKAAMSRRARPRWRRSQSHGGGSVRTRVQFTLLNQYSMKDQLILPQIPPQSANCSRSSARVHIRGGDALSSLLTDRRREGAG